MPDFVRPQFSLASGQSGKKQLRLTKAKRFPEPLITVFRFGEETVSLPRRLCRSFFAFGCCYEAFGGFNFSLKTRTQSVLLESGRHRRRSNEFAQQSGFHDRVCIQRKTR
jgi:hypothetical protein